MAHPDQIQAFVLAAELGSFSAAARRMGKAQSAISTAIANLEIDAGVELFDRQGRSPVLTEAGRSILPHAKGILLSNQEFFSMASSMSEGIETELCIAIEQGISIRPLMDIFHQFSTDFAHVSLELLRPGPNDTATLLKENRADLGLMTEQESYPLGFHFRGVGHSKLVPVCAPSHPLAGAGKVEQGDLRRHRQLIPRSRSLAAVGQIGERKGTSVWYVESPTLIVELLREGIGWAELPLSVLSEHIKEGCLTRLDYEFQQSDILEGIDVVWTEHKALGVAAHWMRDQLLALPQDTWRNDELI